MLCSCTVGWLPCAPVTDISLAQPYELQKASTLSLLEPDSSLAMEPQEDLDAMKSLMENNEAHQSPGTNLLRNLSLIMSQKLYLINMALHPN